MWPNLEMLWASYVIATAKTAKEAEKLIEEQVPTLLQPGVRKIVEASFSGEQ